MALVHFAAIARRAAKAGMEPSSPRWAALCESLTWGEVSLVSEVASSLNVVFQIPHFYMSVKRMQLM